MTGLKLSFLGPAHIVLNGESLELDTRKNIALLAYLGVTAESHTRETLITLLWPELAPSRARAVLRRNLSMLKKSLSGEWLVVEREMVGLERRADLWLDTIQFQQLQKSWQIHGHPEMQPCPACLEDLSAAAAIYRGDFMAGFSLRDSAAFDEWQFYQTEGFRQEFAAVLEKLVRGYCTQERYKDALPHAQNWLSLDPLNEPAQRGLMQLYTWLGNRSAAIRQYKECARVLKEELGVNPEEETIQLFKRIKDGQELPPPGDLSAPQISSQQTVSQTRSHQDDIPRSQRRIERVHIIGRQRELAAASDLWNQTLAGRGQTLLISGEAGVGKTRLVGELIQKIETSGGKALVGGSFMEGGIPYAPFRQIIREVAHSSLFTGSQTESSLPDFVVSALLTLVPELQLPGAELHPPAPAGYQPSETEDHLHGTALDPPAEQQILFENLGIFFRTLSDQTPILLVLEDVQWADSGTIQLMQYLARHSRQARMMMLVTFRNVTPEEAPYMHKILLDLSREQISTRLDLPRLGYEETGELLYAIFLDEITPEFLDGIFSETEGNPFFIEEVCKALVDSGKVYYQDGKWHRPSRKELGIPQNVRVAIQQRISALPAKSQDALNMAAILGREFDFDTLVSTGEDYPVDTQTGYEETLIEALENAERAQLIEQVSADRGGTFSFVHTLIASTLVESLRALNRRQLHKRAAAALEKHHPDDYESLAYHYVQAGEQNNAVNYLVLAADRARVLHAHQEAINGYHLALSIMKESGNLEQAARTSMKLGLTHNNEFDFKAARQAYEDGFILWQQACAFEPLAPTQPAPHPLRLAAYKPETLDFRIVIDTPSVLLSEQLFCGLVEVGAEMEIVPNIAHRWEVLDNGCKYIFHLRDDVHWSDGVQVTAHDFVISWHWVLDPSRGWSAAEYLLDVKNARAYLEGEITDPNLVGVRAIDDTTLQVELGHPTSYFLNSLTVIDTYPFPRHILTEFSDAWVESDKLVTNGPFTLKTWDRDESITVESNPDYHGHFPGNVQQVEYVFNTAKSRVGMQMYADNELDLLCDLSPGEMIEARQKFSGEYVTGPWLSTDFIGFDVSRPPFNDLRVRQAFAHATDKGLLSDIALRGFGFPATGGLVPPGMPGHSPEIGLPYDPERARQLLAESGFPGGRGFPGISCLARDDPGHDLLCTFLQTQWQAVLGVDIHWEVTEWGTFSEKNVLENLHMWMVAWTADYPDPDDFLRVLWWKDPAWQHTEYLRLVENAKRVMDQEERMRLYQQADKILVEEVPLLPLSYGRIHMLVKPWVKRLPTSPLKNWFWKDIILEEH